MRKKREEKGFEFMLRMSFRDLRTIGGVHRVHGLFCRDQALEKLTRKSQGKAKQGINLDTDLGFAVTRQRTSSEACHLTPFARVRGMQEVTVGVLALQGAFHEHIQLLRQAEHILQSQSTSAADSNHDAIPRTWKFLEVRNERELDKCDALIIPGGESTAISLVAERSNMLEPLRDFVK